MNEYEEQQRANILAQLISQIQPTTDAEMAVVIKLAEQAFKWVKSGTTPS